MKKLDILAAVLVAVGGINWGLVAVAKFELSKHMTVPRSGHASLEEMPVTRG